MKRTQKRPARIVKRETIHIPIDTWIANLTFAIEAKQWTEVQSVLRGLIRFKNTVARHKA